MDEKSNQPILAIIIPSYNEAQILEDSATELSAILNILIEKNEISPESYLSFIDDGSTDETHSILDNLADKNKLIKYIRLAYNHGQQKALHCGITENYADIYITIDCDLQDDISIIPDMVRTFKQKDIDVVYTVRKDRKIDSAIKKFCAELFYKSYSLFGIKSLQNSADYRLISNKVANVLREFKEKNICFRGLLFGLGFKYDIVYFDRKQRIGGETKYTFFKQLQLAIDCITSLSTRPIKFISALGLLFIILSVFKLSLVLFVGGCNLFAIGIIGEYIAKTYAETQNRPLWIISERKN